MKERIPERFDELGLIPQLVTAVHEQGYERPTPIQARAIPQLLTGRDLLGLAQTGTGKTAAFALPILQRLHQQPPPREGARGPRPTRVLVLTPTRELAAQIEESFRVYGRHLHLRTAVIFGGVGMEPQKQTLRAGIDILIATPGRLLDLAGQGFVHLERLDVFVLDEADRMLDMGFIHDVKRVIRLLPERRQTLFFSATMPPEAQALADQLLHDPATVAVAPVSSTADRIEQEVAFVEKDDKRALLVEVLRDLAMRRVLVFSRTKHGANRIAEHLVKHGVGAEAIHGNKSQGARERALANFKAGQIRVLVATDIAARGIDIDEITHIVNFDLPEVPETYVHRIGRTARAGASGSALSFCAADEHDLLDGIEKLIRRRIPVIEGHPYESHEPRRPPPPQGHGKADAARAGGRPGGGRHGGMRPGAL
ncbi:MAG TPA: DEAD/DEAH box helicase, partial [Kofleriaceae bacterium]|nr:DEAD/DEAH box helicase [Kofleriaceae bacterium]